ncbi:hypothetical protein HDU76_006642, partial [Blyttiomyces sp. JEL0837]
MATTTTVMPHGKSTPSSTSTSIPHPSSTSSSTSINLPPSTLFNDGPTKGIRISGWEIKTTKCPIYNSAELDEASTKIPIPLPEMFFGNNELKLTHESSGTCIVLNAMDAIQKVDMTDDASNRIKVAHADHWVSKNRAESGKIKDVVKPFDWTYTSDYMGTLISESTKFEPTTTPINLEPLKRPDPILFYDELVLYEDELADNGTSMMTARVRVMPTCFLVLLRLFLRVDNVLFRIYDTRLFHMFGSDHLIREFTAREEPYAKVRA